MTIQQAMQRTDVSRRTIYNWLHSGKIGYLRTPGGAVRIFEDTLFRPIDPASTPPPPPSVDA